METTDGASESVRRRESEAAAEAEAEEEERDSFLGKFLFRNPTSSKYST